MPAKSYQLKENYLLGILNDWDAIEGLIDLSNQTGVHINTLKNMNSGKSVSINSIRTISKFLGIDFKDFIVSKGKSVNLIPKSSSIDVSTGNEKKFKIDTNAVMIPLELITLQNWREKFSSIVNSIDINLPCPVIRWSLYADIPEGISNTLKTLDNSFKEISNIRESKLDELAGTPEVYFDTIDLYNFELDNQIRINEEKRLLISDDLMSNLFLLLKLNSLYMHVSDYYIWNYKTEKISHQLGSPDRKIFSSKFIKLIIITDNLRNSVGVNIGDPPLPNLKENKITYQDILKFFEQNEDISEVVIKHDRKTKYYDKPSNIFG